MKISLTLIGLLFMISLIYPFNFFIDSVLSTTQESNTVGTVPESDSDTPLPKTAQVKSKPYVVRVGQELFMNYCQVCHGVTGEGDGFNAYILPTKPRNFTDSEYMNALSNDRLAEAIREGGRGVNKSLLMPAWGNTLSQLEISFLVEYIRTFGETTTGEGTAIPQW